MMKYLHTFFVSSLQLKVSGLACFLVHLTFHTRARQSLATWEREENVAVSLVSIMNYWGKKPQ